MLRQDDVLHLIIEDQVTTSQTAGNKVNQATDLSDGEVVVCDVDGTVLDDTGSGANQVQTRDRVVLVGRQGTKLFKSPDIVGSNITSYLAQTSVAATEQIDIIGYNGTSGSIEAIDDNDYTIRINRKDIQSTFGNKQEKKYGFYRSDASATEKEVAEGLTKNLIENFNLHRVRNQEVEMRFTMLNNDAATNTELGGLGNPTGNLSVTQDSKTVAMTDSQDLAVGDALRFSASATEALGDSTYIIETVDSATQITLSTPYQGATNAAYDDDNIHLIASADATAASWGITMTGVARRFTPGVFKYSKAEWAYSLEGFGTTTTTASQAASKGVGTYEEVAELEYFTQGNLGKIERLDVPPPTLFANAESGDAYSLLAIEWYDNSKSGIQGTPRSKKQLIIAANIGTDPSSQTLGTCITDGTIGVADVLDAWVVAKGTGTAQEANL